MNAKLWRMQKGKVGSTLVVQQTCIWEGNCLVATSITQCRWAMVRASAQVVHALGALNNLPDSKTSNESTISLLRTALQQHFGSSEAAQK